MTPCRHPPHRLTCSAGAGVHSLEWRGEGACHGMTFFSSLQRSLKLASTLLLCCNLLLGCVVDAVGVFYHLLHVHHPLPQHISAHRQLGFRLCKSSCLDLQAFWELSTGMPCKLDR